MATKLKEFDFSHQSRLTPLGEQDDYPWDEWFDGDIWQIEYGEDFSPHPLMMERIVRTRVVSREGKVTLRHVGKDGEPWGFIVLQRTDLVGPMARRKREAAAKRAAKRAATSATVAETEPVTRVKQPVTKRTPAVKKLASPVNGKVTKRVSKKIAAPA